MVSALPLVEAATPARVLVAGAGAVPTLPDPPWKRPLDVVLAAGLTLAALPLCILIAGAVMLTSRGPALHVQDAVGRGGRPFRLYKFRTMRAGNDDARHRQYIATFVGGRVAAGDATAGDSPFKMRDDDRVTPVGRVLRRTSLDELPQLWNVLKGDMSLVGPRPPLPYEFELYGVGAMGRLAVRPGITGLYQVTGRSRVSFRRMLEIDVDYIRRRSLWLDFAILLRTVPAALLGRGAC